MFICVAVIVDEDGLQETEKKIKELSDEQCSGGEIRSSNIGKNHARRLKFLNFIKDLPFAYYALVINKDKIPSESGLKYKPSFYKYINRMLYGHLEQTGCNLRLVADEIGSNKFMDSFQNYIHEKGKPDLLTEFEHSFVKSHESPLNQLADLIVGTLSYCFDANKRCAESVEFRNLLRSKEITIQCWPLNLEPLPKKAPDCNKEWDNYLKTTARNRAINFITKNEDSESSNNIMQASIVRYLLFAREFEDKSKQAIIADELIEKLQKDGFEIFSKQAFTSKIIGKIREAGIILSGSNEGYRLALSIADIQDYLNHDKGVIEPMLNRLSIAQKTVKYDLLNKYDILDQLGLVTLKKLVEVFYENKITQGVLENQGSLVESES